MRPLCGLALAAGLLAVGCSSEADAWTARRPKVVPVTGRVLLSGVAVDGAGVTFINEAAGRSAFGRTGPDGRFRLTTFEPNDGAVPGPQRVAVRKTEVEEQAEPGKDYSVTNQLPPPAVEHWLLPKRYASPATSGLTAEVAAGGRNDFTFELSE
jgi:hypothetical protein